MNSGTSLSNYGIINGMVLPIILFPDIIVKTFSSLLIPEFARYHAKKDYERIKQISTILLSCILGASILLCIFIVIFSSALGEFIYKDARCKLLY